uniref:Uncharacterized protein n=1 Tax=Quercus lobata TaxID=97700 RepID=A0A7N2L2W6_QUELO
MENATVDCLVDEKTGKWDAEMLEGILILAEAELAKKIPLPRSQTEDVLVGQEVLEEHLVPRSPNKFKNLVWRSCRKSLPTKQNLTQKTIKENPICD